MDRDKGTAMGAISYLEKPVTSQAVEGAFTHVKNFIDRDVRELLVVEDDEVQRSSITELLKAADVNVTAVPTGEAALAALKKSHFDCVVLDLSLPDMAGFDVLKRMRRQQKHQNLPVVIYTSKDLTKQEETQLKRYAATIITKSASSSEQLLDDTALFLHRVVEKMPEPARRVVHSRNKPVVTESRTPVGAAAVAVRPREDVSKSFYLSPDNPLAGRKVLIIDDDVRNIFALTSMLESQGMAVIFDESGREGLETLKHVPDVELVLIDIMMPELDGYETTRAIRALAGREHLPIITLTAKAMEEDRARAMEAGATDYITKPVNMDLLFEMMRRHLGVPNG
jgi:CheY-like chemotaxis protein